MHRLAQPILATTVVTPEFLQSLQEEIANVVEYSGLILKTMSKDTRAQLWESLQRYWVLRNGYDVVVSTQKQFNDLFTRTGANAYKIKDQYRSALIRNLSGGYLCYGDNSILQSGDTYAVISTNFCTHLVFESGAYLAIGNTPSYVIVNIDDCRLDNVWVKGSGASGSSSYGFVLGANRVTYNNCKVSDILSTVTLIGFCSSGTPLHNYTSKYINCSVSNITVSTATKDINGFFGCYNLSNCLVYNCTTAGGGQDCYGFNSCNNLANCFVNILAAPLARNAIGFVLCNNLSSCSVISTTTVTGPSSGFNQCSRLSSCYATTIATSGAGLSYAFGTCTIMSSCWADVVTTVGGTANGFNSCSYMASCYTAIVANAGNTYVCSLDVNIIKQESTPEVFT